MMCLVVWSLCAASTRSNFFLYVQSIQGSDLTKCLTLSVSYQLTVFNNLKVYVGMMLIWETRYLLYFIEYFKEPSILR